MFIEFLTIFAENSKNVQKYCEKIDPSDEILKYTIKHTFVSKVWKTETDKISFLFDK